MTNEEVLQKILDRLDGIEKKQTSLGEGQKNSEKNFSSLERGQKNIEQRFTPLEQGQKNLEQRFTLLEQAQKNSEKRLKIYIKKSESVIVKHFDDRLGDHEKRIKRVENHLKLPQIV